MSAATAHAAFLEARRAYIGGTDIAAITGVSQWASPLSVYLDKTAPEASDDSDSLPMRRGLALEQFIADEFERARPSLVTYHPRPIVRTDWGFPAGASVDRLVAQRDKPRTPVAVLECKTAFRFGWRDWDENSADLPDSYYVQCQWYLAVTGLSVIYGAADVGDEKLRIIPIEADERIQTRLIESGREFWQTHVERGVPPEPTGTDADAQALRRMYPETVEEPVVYIADEDAQTILSDYLAHKFNAETETRAAELAKQRLQSLMGENERAVVGRWRLTWAQQTRHTIDSKRLKAERPDIAAEYAKESVSRTFQPPKEITA
jgi:putative phage-type endonuclease